jgi:hypothetical protein
MLLQAKVECIFDSLHNTLHYQAKWSANDFKTEIINFSTRLKVRRKPSKKIKLVVEKWLAGPPGFLTTS